MVLPPMAALAVIVVPHPWDNGTYVRKENKMKELKDYTVAELLDEVNRRDEVFTASAWMRIDVEQAFDDAEREWDDETITRFMDEFNDSFNERENEEGFERLNVYVTELFD